MEVTLRDGLQNEKFTLSLGQKQALVHQLVDSGFRHIEVGSFVNPKAVPQMADTGRLLESLPASGAVTYYALVPNKKGYDRAIAAGCRHVNFVLSVTETMNRRNVGMSTEEGFRQLQEIHQLAQQDGVKLRVYLAVIFHCPFEGPTSLETARHWIERVAALGVADICLADTDGKAEPKPVENLLLASKPLVESIAPQTFVSLHLHNTYGYADDNVRVALRCGIRHFDGATAGLGGCPFAPGAKGNVATERLVQLCEESGFVTGINPKKLADVAHWLTDAKNAADAAIG
jgi:isopropylmalate/homocitrate/citramalate synthase